MARRYGAPYYGKRYLGNTDKMIVHDLDNEDTDENACQIDEIKHDHIKMFDALYDAHKEEFEDCDYCIS
jgi:hypothetical protein